MPVSSHWTTTHELHRRSKLHLKRGSESHRFQETRSPSIGLDLEAAISAGQSLLTTSDTEHSNPTRSASFLVPSIVWSIFRTERNVSRTPVWLAKTTLERCVTLRHSFSYSSDFFGFCFVGSWVLNFTFLVLKARGFKMRVSAKSYHSMTASCFTNLHFILKQNNAHRIITFITALLTAASLIPFTFSF
ncbi:uncharacterized protein LAJ45_10761 [Morchella importuna]|uniref:uncharacterized protein n=1 Tax=Morchella importuna TaxID=1174673 RepID=UPI001E8E80E9|nr:uncharacterized protein LAJ45_10761 [Morchella importuna]KAH8145201.1 hypothetical protein LAJ45_10761 [Morchella importuna]